MLAFIYQPIISSFNTYTNRRELPDGLLSKKRAKFRIRKKGNDVCNLHLADAAHDAALSTKQDFRFLILSASRARARAREKQRRRPVLQFQCPRTRFRARQALRAAAVKLKIKSRVVSGC